MRQGWGIDTAALMHVPGAERLLQNYAVILRLDIECSYPTLAEAASVFSCLPEGDQPQAKTSFVRWAGGEGANWRRRILEQLDDQAICPHFASHCCAAGSHALPGI